MEELLIGSILIWALGRITKKKADAPAPGTIAPAPQQRSSQGAPQQMVTPNPNPQGNPGSPAGGSPVTGGPGYDPNAFKKFV